MLGKRLHFSKDLSAKSVPYVIDSGFGTLIHVLIEAFYSTKQTLFSLLILRAPSAFHLYNLVCQKCSEPGCRGQIEFLLLSENHERPHYFDGNDENIFSNPFKPLL